ncbi:unnamed protein product [Wickerhamomyces anomalus]
MKLLRLRRNQRLFISISLGSLLVVLIIITGLHYNEITPATIQKSLNLESFINLSNNESHIPPSPGSTQFQYPQLSFQDDQFQINSIDEKINHISNFKNFINDEIFKPISQESNIKKVSSLNHKHHYVGGKKSGHFAGPVKENYQQDPIYTKEFLLKFLTLNPKEVQLMKKSHSTMVKSLPKKFPDVLTSNFQPNGYVYVGGSHFNYLVLLSLKSLRASGSVFPVEVLIPKMVEFDVELCNYIFPLYNAKCLVIEDFITKETSKKINKYQMKSIALLINSFKNVMLLDSDNMILKNPDYLFLNEPFKSKGFISWPDLWRRATSPFFYKISGVSINDYKKIRNSYWHILKKQFHDIKPDWLYSYHDFEGTIQETSSESGQLLINRETHAKTIFLSTYYNFYGPDYYYPLLTQNSHGEGDKETYISAAHALGQTYYQVEEFARDFHKNHHRVKFGRQRDIIGIGQYDPMIDYNRSTLMTLEESKRNDVDQFKYSSGHSIWEYKIWNQSELMFLHCNWPKLYTWDLIKSKGIRSFKNAKGKRQRLYDGLINELGGKRDFELEIVGYMKWYFCEHEDLQIRGVFNIDYDAFCVELGEHYKYLEKNVF